jgi:AcrR family transcriptional regulator
MADEIGLDSLTLAALAARLGVRQPSLYKHLDSLSGLRRSISISSKRALGDVLARATVGRAGADAISAMAHAYREWALAHPGRYQAANLMPAAGDDDVEVASTEVVQIIADVLAAYDLDGDDAVDAIRAFRATLHGFVSLESAGGFALSADVDRSFERLIRGFLAGLSQWSAA